VLSADGYIVVAEFANQIGQAAGEQK